MGEFFFEFDDKWHKENERRRRLVNNLTSDISRSKYAAIERFLLQNQADPKTHTTVYFPEVQTKTDKGYQFSQRIGLAPQCFEQFSEDWPSFIFEYEIINRSSHE